MWQKYYFVLIHISFSTTSNYCAFSYRTFQIKYNLLLNVLDYVVIYYNFAIWLILIKENTFQTIVCQMAVICPGLNLWTPLMLNLFQKTWKISFHFLTFLNTLFQHLHNVISYTGKMIYILMLNQGLEGLRSHCDTLSFIWHCMACSGVL